MLDISSADDRHSHLGFIGCIFDDIEDGVPNPKNAATRFFWPLA
jgi:hypothetical protein